jgi:hypothetical protein
VSLDSIDTESVSVGDYVYSRDYFDDGYIPSCNFVAGNYWLVNSNSVNNLGIIPNNPSQPNMIIITVNSERIITAINTCYYLP